MRFWELLLSEKAVVIVPNGDKVLVGLGGINSSELCGASSLDRVVFG